MKTFTKTASTMVLSVALLAACGDDEEDIANDATKPADDTNEKEAEDSEIPEDEVAGDETAATEEDEENDENTDDLNEESDEESNGNSDDTVMDDGMHIGDDLLGLGETVTLEDSYGTYEITPDNPRFLDYFEHPNDSDEVFDSNWEFLAIDYDITIISDEGLEDESNEQLSASLYYEGEGVAQRPAEFQLRNWLGDMEEGESDTATVLYETSEGGDYKILLSPGLISVEGDDPFESEQIPELEESFEFTIEAEEDS
ncbi:hypothetical protein HUG15_19810 [Salicibibacter cibarius]|uniref:Uncharacterized protein n=1 Tax=Salicibibacter cibarius TaxID=2743000 RepID=A0A7T6Z6K8_9BACI|nr:hypothetical protein [Salicibibacter cibarius]QQK77607.1 hypothetical protein HUG15_19810 [Salicibibacter cibarius]